MRQRRRLTNTLKWTGTIAAIALTLVFAASLKYWFVWRPTIDDAVMVLNGQLRASRDRGNPWATNLFHTAGFEIKTLPESRVGRVGWWFHWDWYHSQWCQVAVPLWAPLLAIAVPTALLWRRSWKRLPTGTCPTCSYDLTGNTTGVCPECGKSADGNVADSVNQ